MKIEQKKRRNLSLSSLHGGTDGIAFSRILRKEQRRAVLAAWFIGYIDQVWFAHASLAEMRATRESLKGFTGSICIKNRLPVHLEHSHSGWRGGQQYITLLTLTHSYNDFGIRCAHIGTVNTAVTSLLLDLQRGYCHGYT